MLKFVVTRRSENQSFSREVSKTDFNNSNNNDILPQITTPQKTSTSKLAADNHNNNNNNDRPSSRCKKKKRLAETRHAIILRQQKHRSLSMGGSVKSESEDEGSANGSIHAWSVCSTPRLVSRWNNPSVDVDDFETTDDDHSPFQRYFRAATGDAPEPSKASPITILIDKCSELSDSNMTLDGKHMSCSSFDTCISSATSSNDLSNRTESPSSSVICFGSSTKTVRLELRKRSDCKKFGFTVVGGVDSPRGPMGIYVKTVHEEGLAAGLLQKGDELTSVNGKELKDMTHSDAVGLIKSSGKEGYLSLVLKRFQPSAKSRCDSYDEGIVSSSTQNSPIIYNESNMSAITMHLKKLASKLDEDALSSFVSSSSFDQTLLQLSSQSDGTLKSTAQGNSGACDDNHSRDRSDKSDISSTFQSSPSHSLHHLDCNKQSSDSKTDDNNNTIIINNKNNSNNNNNNNNNNKGLSRLMTRAAYDFGDKYSYTVLDRHRLEQVFIFDC